MNAGATGHTAPRSAHSRDDRTPDDPPNRATAPRPASKLDSELSELTNATLVYLEGRACPPCRQMDSIVEELAAEFADTIHVLTVDVDDERAFTHRLGFTSIPTFVFVRNGRRVAALEGARPKTELRAMITAQLLDL